MKILNEKSLLHFATCNSPTDKEGYLYKKWDVSKSFQKRWFTLKGNLLFYYRKKGEREPVGVIILEGHTIELAEDTDNFVFVINFAGTNSSTYCLGAQSQEIMESWMKTLSCAAYEFMKIKLFELESKLEEFSVTGATLVQVAAEDGHILSQVYGTVADITPSSVDAHTRRCAVALTPTVSMANKENLQHFSNEGLTRDTDEAERLCPIFKIPRVEIVTWAVVGLYSFAEMHEFIRQQINEFQNQSNETVT